MSVFISYRRSDTQQAAGRVADRLIERFGREAVVIDVDTDQVGRDYRTLISEHLEAAQVVLALIGPRFMAEGSDGRRRLDRPHDVLRLELTRALERGVPIIPVLVDGAELPDPADLPDDLRDLVFRGSVELAHHRFDRDYSFLEEQVARFFEPAVSAGRSGTDESPSAAAAPADRATAENAAAERAEREAAEEAERETAAAAERAEREAAEEVDALSVPAVAPKEKVPEAEVGPIDTAGTLRRSAVWSISDIPTWGWIALAVLVIGGAVGAATALSGGDGGVVECDDVVDESIVRLQDFLDVLSGVGPEATALSDEQTEAISDINDRGAELRANATELSCDVAELEAMIIGRFDELEADGQVAQATLESLKGNPSVW